jgi:hypothetical protein
MNEDRTAHGELHELRRRVETLETAPRIPTFSTSTGIKSSVFWGGSLASAAAVVASDLDGESEFVVDLDDALSGFAMIYFGCTASGGTASTHTMTLSLKIYSDSIGEMAGVNEPYASHSAVGTGTLACVRHTAVPPTGDGHVALKFTKAAGAFTATFLTPYIVVVPL